jgi:hypothetical protein
MKQWLHYLLHGAGYYFKSWVRLSLSKKCTAFLWNPKVHYSVHTSPPLDPILSQVNPVRPIDPYFTKIHLNVILTPTPRSSQWSLAFGPPNQNPINTCPLPHVCGDYIYRTNFKNVLSERFTISKWLNWSSPASEIIWQWIKVHNSKLSRQIGDGDRMRI